MSRRIFGFAGLCAIAVLSIASGAVHVQSAPPVPDARPGISEFRGYVLVHDGLEDDIWRLASGGRATMVYSRRGGPEGCRAIECDGGDEGTWSRRGGQICIAWRTRRDISGCYTIVPRTSTNVQLVGPVTFEGTLGAG